MALEVRPRPHRPGGRRRHGGPGAAFLASSGQVGRAAPGRRPWKRACDSDSEATGRPRPASRAPWFGCLWPAVGPLRPLAHSVSRSLPLSGSLGAGTVTRQAAAAFALPRGRVTFIEVGSSRGPCVSRAGSGRLGEPNPRLRVDFKLNLNTPRYTLATRAGFAFPRCSKARSVAGMLS